MIKLLVMVFSLVLPGITSALTLQNLQRQIEIQPETLAVSWLDKNGVRRLANAGVEAQTVTELVVEGDESHWRWPDAGVTVSAILQGNDLTLSFNAEKTGLLPWFVLPEKTETLALPLSEGMRVPLSNKAWSRYLASEYEQVNTTYDFKLPLWTQQQDDITMSWILLNPYNNQVQFREKAQSNLSMRSAHDFTALNLNEPFQVMLHVEQLEKGQSSIDSLLSGARRYRAYLQESGQFNRFAEKVQRFPQTKKMIGAIQVYLWGQALLSEADVKNWRQFAQYLRTREATWLTAFFSDEAQQLLLDLPESIAWLDRYQQRVLIDAVNQALVAQIPNPESADNLKAARDQASKRKKRVKEKVGKYLHTEESWGQGTSLPVIQALQNAGIKDLWLGLDDWTGAFYHPEAVAEAIKAGYLIGPYDSYNTAIPKGVNDSWLTAQIPDDIRNECAIQHVSGEKQKGFQKKGFYLNPLCRQEYPKQRMQQILSLGGFNSYFLDVDGTAMVREDYYPSRRSSERQMTEAFNARMNWVTEQRIVLGSEDGNALTTQSLVFAHGLETIGFGWMDADMKKNSQSPYFLGRWYPQEAPAVFFKQAKVKEPYKTLLFSPQFRLPLYQTVFHDAHVSSHHWSFDSLKFSDVQTERDLIAMLYNTPPMVHISRSSLTTRLDALKHYQQGYSFAHHRLWDKALIGLKFLAENGQVQQSHFSDGSYITVNFGTESYASAGLHLPPHSALITLANGESRLWTSRPWVN